MDVMNNSSGDMRVTHTRELPLILHREIEQCDRNSTLWKSYEAFIQYRYLPAIERIGEIVDEHGHLMEPVPPHRMKEIFKMSGNGYGLRWSSRTGLLERVNRSTANHSGHVTRCECSCVSRR